MMNGAIKSAVAGDRQETILALERILGEVEKH